MMERKNSTAQHSTPNSNSLEMPFTLVEGGQGDYQHAAHNQPVSQTPPIPGGCRLVLAGHGLRRLVGHEDECDELKA